MAVDGAAVNPWLPSRPEPVVRGAIAALLPGTSSPVRLAFMQWATAGIDKLRAASLSAYPLSTSHRLLTMPNTSNTSSTPGSRGQIAYTAYCKRVDFKAINGEELPLFFDMPEDRRAGWIASADAIWQLATTGVIHM